MNIFITDKFTLLIWSPLHVNGLRLLTFKLHWKVDTVDGKPVR